MEKLLNLQNKLDQRIILNFFLFLGLNSLNYNRSHPILYRLSHSSLNLLIPISLLNFLLLCITSSHISLIHTLVLIPLGLGIAKNSERQKIKRAFLQSN